MAGATRPGVRLPQGRVRGVRGDGWESFLGIPYGTVKRFGAPADAEWEGRLDADRFGPPAPQPARALAEFVHGPCPPASEQRCLSLNIWRPTSVDEPLPVLVWLHGGGFTFGWSGSSLYDGARLARRAGIIVVTVNYRLGSLGWLYHPELREHAAAPAGNWGLLDQAAALGWVAEHISAFGGDPTRVTLAGQSAGALSVLDHLVSDLAAGLFHRAIVQSAPIFDAAGDPELGAAWAEALSEHLGGSRGSLDADLLRSCTARDIISAHEELLREPRFARSPLGGALPIVDLATLPAAPVGRSQASPAVEMLIGHTADEGTFFFRLARRVEPDDEQLQTIVGHLHGDGDPATTIADYRDRAGVAVDNHTLLVAIATDLMVRLPVMRWVAARVLSGATVHTYRVDHGAADPDLGAMHMVDVPLVFGTDLSSEPGRRLVASDAETARVSRAMTEAWGGFIRHGDPGWPVAAPSAADPVSSTTGGGVPGHVFGRAGPRTRTLRALGACR